MFVEQDGERAVVDQGDFHLCPELSGLDTVAGAAAFFDDVFIQCFCVGGVSCVCEAWTVAFAAVCIQCKLGYQEEFSPDIFQRQVGFSLCVC